MNADDQLLKELRRRLDRQTQSAGGLRHATVIGDDRSELVSDDLCRREVDGVEAAELCVGRQGCRAVEQVGREHDLIETGQLSACLLKSRPPAGAHGPWYLDAGERARHELIMPMSPQEAP